MIRVRLDYLLVDRQIKLKDLAERTGIAMNNLSILKTNKARAIRFSTLQAICLALHCTPGELLEFVPDTASAGQSAEIEAQQNTRVLQSESEI